jgi:hypothetical protein
MKRVRQLLPHAIALLSVATICLVIVGWITTHNRRNSTYLLTFGDSARSAQYALSISSDWVFLEKYWGYPPDNFDPQAQLRSKTQVERYGVRLSVVYDRDFAGLRLGRYDHIPIAIDSSGNELRTLPGIYGHQLLLGTSFYWPLAASCAYLIPYTLLALRRRSQNARRRKNQCVTCGYDLRATPDRCPECGTIPGATSNAANTVPRKSEVK